MINKKENKMIRSIYKIKKGTHLSRCKEVNGILTSDNIKAPKDLYIFNTIAKEEFDSQINESFLEFNHKELGEFSVEKKLVEVKDRYLCI